MTMIERVERAMKEFVSRPLPNATNPPTTINLELVLAGSLGDVWSLVARAVLAAIREPDEAMRNAARDWSAAKYGKPVGHAGTDGCWTSQIDAILAGETK
jgi:hypothetical protein